MTTDYNRKHPLYLVSKYKRDKAMDLYEGGQRVEGREEYLVRHPYETLKQYEIRLERSTYRNFAAPIVDVFSSYICDKRPQRTIPDVLAPMLADIDRRQTDADVFFSNQTRLAAARGASFILCDMEQARGRTQAEDMLAGRRSLPYFLAIDPDDVYDWSIDERGLEWVVIHSVEPLGSQPFAAPQGCDVLTVWTRKGWQKYAGPPRSLDTVGNASIDGSLGAGMSLVAENGHPLGEVPLVPILFEPHTPMTGLPATDDVLSLILRVYRRDSELDKMLFDCAVPLAIINGLDVEQKDAFIRSSSNILVSSAHQGITGEYLEPGGHSFAALRESLQSDVQSIREIALRMVRPETQRAISAESKSIDKQQLDTQLANYAHRCANAEKKCFELAWRWLHNGEAPAPESIRTPYNEDYSIGEMEKLDRAYLLEMYRSGAVSRETYLRFLQKLGVIGEDFDIGAEAAAAEANEKAD